MLRIAAVFVAIVGALFAFELTPPGQHLFVDPWTAAVAQTSAAAMRLFDPAVLVSGAMLASTKTGFAVTILAGCNGVEATIVLAAAMLAFPAPWKHRAAGILIGTLAIQLLNIVRVVSLFYLGQWDRDVFEWAHLYLWQALIMLDALVVWILWLRTVPVARPNPV
jgi:exosortase H (IPTLxxWG-CTERM-specific)